MSPAIIRYPTPLPVPFSKAVRAGGFIFLSGVLAMDAQGGIDTRACKHRCTREQRWRSRSRLSSGEDAPHLQPMWRELTHRMLCKTYTPRAHTEYWRTRALAASPAKHAPPSRPVVP